ncbi:MAG: prolyl oligopeptidase family protein, partial [Leptothrix sp. (in: b-proteobacteria)]
LPDYAELRPRLLEVLNARDRIPNVTRRGAWFYNFWQDAAHPRGLWRRTTLADYRQREPAWQTVIDLDALAAAEGEDWVWKGATVLAPAWRRSLVSLSRGGADACVVREFDVDAGTFLPAEAGGFTLPEAKSDVSWLDADTLLVGTDVGPGSLTDSGYPRSVRRWRRGTPLADAPTLIEGEASDVSVWASVDRRPEGTRVLLGRSLDFYTTRAWLWQPDAAALSGIGTLIELAKPADAELDLHGDWAALKLRSDWAVDGQTHPSGALLVGCAAALLAGAPRWRRVFTPEARRSLDHWSWTRGHLLLNVMANVSNRVEACALPAEATDASLFDPLAWRFEPVSLPGPGTLSVAALHDPWTPADTLGEQFLVHYTDFLTPDQLLIGGLDGTPLQVLKQRPVQFDASGLVVEQLEATSADGTRVPYFVVRPRDAAPNGDQNGDHPTLLYGYGGFEVSLQPWYSGVFGQAWFARGGVLVVANIRGGGEFGPAWHQAAVKATKQRSYDDFIAVAEDLIARGITRPARLGIMGGSNGGLLVGATFTQRPELFGAVVCQVPLLDMQRYHRLLAGASWMAEYGDPDQPDEWAVIARYSPYQNLRSGVRYPRVLFTTSTRDDRVHPGHARKMVARLRELGQPVLYFENLAGGHGGAADNDQRAHLQALEYSYLWAQLGGASAA